MKTIKTRHIIPLAALIALLITAGCSTEKNTAQSRWWHSFNARYNTYYNGTLAYTQICHKTYYKPGDVESIIRIVEERRKRAESMGKSI